MKDFDDKEAIEEHDRLSKLFTDNRFAFEIERKKRIEELISNAPPEMQERLKEIQGNIDRVLGSAGSEDNRFVMMQEIFWNHVNNEFIPTLESLKPSPEDKGPRLKLIK